MKVIRFTIIILILTIGTGYVFFTYFDWWSAKEFQKDVDWLFWACVKILQDWGRWTGLGYNLLNTKRNLLTKFSDLDIERFKKINSELKENVIKNANKTDLKLREPHENFKKKNLASKTF